VTAARRTVAVAVLESLKAAGVKSVFGLPGVHNLAFWESDGFDVPTIVLARHEQTTVYAADGLARATGGLGVALTTTGPGVANAAGAFGEAASVGSPVLLISSEVSTRTARAGTMRGGLHESRDQAAIFAPLAKGVFRPRTAIAAVQAVADAAALAMQWPRGPVYVDIPIDILESLGELVPIESPIRRGVTDDAIERALELVTRSESVVIWAGGGVVQSGAESALVELAERLDAPVVTTWAGRGVMPSGHKLAVDLPPHERLVADLIAAADLLIGIGTEFDGPNTKAWTLQMPASILTINADAVDASKNYPADVALVGDASAVLAQLVKRLEPRNRPSGYNLAALRDAVIARDSSDERTASASTFVSAVEAAARRSEAIVINDMSVGGYWVGGYARFAHSRRMQYPIGWGTLGYALPASLGAGVADAGPVIAICGDGGIMFALGELAALVETGAPVTVLLVDDGGYGMLRFDQVVNGHAERGVDLVRPDFAAVAAAFGIPCAIVKVDELEHALNEAIDAKAPRMVLVNHRLYPPLTVSARWSE